MWFEQKEHQFRHDICEVHIVPVKITVTNYRPFAMQLLLLFYLSQLSSIGIVYFISFRNEWLALSENHGYRDEYVVLPMNSRLTRT